MTLVLPVYFFIRFGEFHAGIHPCPAMLSVQFSYDLAIKNNDGNTPYQDSCSMYGANCEMANFLWSKLTVEQKAEQGPSRRPT